MVCRVPNCNIAVRRVALLTSARNCNRLSTVTTKAWSGFRESRRGWRSFAPWDCGS